MLQNTRRSLRIVQCCRRRTHLSSVVQRGFFVGAQCRQHTPRDDDNAAPQGVVLPEQPSLKRSPEIRSLGTVKGPHPTLDQWLEQKEPASTTGPGPTSLDDFFAKKSPSRKRAFEIGSAYTTDTRRNPIEDLIRKIEPIKDPHPTFTQGSVTLLLLLTPGYARHALEEQLPLTVIEQLCGKLRPGLSVQSVTAVVDHLSTPQKNKGAGAEGVSYLISNSLPKTFEHEGESLQPSVQKPGSLNFQIQLDSRLIKRGKKRQPLTWRLQLPLATTVFSTGLVSTLIRKQYEWDETLGAARSVSQRRLTSWTIQLPLVTQERSLRADVPLVQLTSPRKVESSMGNIIRSLSSGNKMTGQGNGLEEASPTGDASSVPASRELEAAVNAYFQAVNEPPAPVNVWAVVIPGTGPDLDVRQDFRHELFNDPDVLRKGWKAGLQDNVSRRHFVSVLSQQVRKGCRLMKVLSGGGGWGKKAGLLSIDPDLDYSTREIRDEWEDLGDLTTNSTTGSVHGDIGKALGNSVKEGDWIMFLLATESGVEEHELVDMQPPPDPVITFGTAIPDAGTTQDVTETETEAVKDPEVESVHVPNHFGALSESGMALTILSGGMVIHKTKLDVPSLTVGCNYTDVSDKNSDPTKEADPKKGQNPKRKRRIFRTCMVGQA